MICEIETLYEKLFTKCCFTITFDINPGLHTAWILSNNRILYQKALFFMF